MSWNAFIDQLIGGSKGSADQGSIIGFNGSKMTTDEHACNIKMSDEEAQTIGKAFESKDLTTFMQGIKIGGVTYACLRYEEDKMLVLGKKAGSGCISLQGTKTAVVIAHTLEGKSQGLTNDGLAQLVDYLSSLGI